MTNRIPLGKADTHSRLLGIRRSQISGAAFGIFALSDYVLTSSSFGVLFVSLLSLISVIPVKSQGTVGDFLITAGKFLLRRRSFEISPGSQFSYRLDQIGRLDLSGMDSEVVTSLKQFSTTLALEAETSEFQISLSRNFANSETTIQTISQAKPSEIWLPVSKKPEVVSAFESWREIRIEDSFYAVLSLDDFSLARRQRQVLSRFLGWLPSGLMIMRIQVFGTQRGVRMTARVAHRVSIDSTVTQALGFRADSRARVEMERKKQQELEVESGAAFMKIGLFLICSGSTRQSCRSRVKACIQEARRSGLPMRVRVGEQRTLFEALVPQVKIA